MTPTVENVLQIRKWPDYTVKHYQGNCKLTCETFTPAFLPVRPARHLTAQSNFGATTFVVIISLSCIVDTPSSHSSILTVQDKSPVTGT